MDHREDAGVLDDAVETGQGVAFGPEGEDRGVVGEVEGPDQDFRVSGACGEDCFARCFSIRCVSASDDEGRDPQADEVLAAVESET